MAEPWKDYGIDKEEWQVLARKERVKKKGDIIKREAKAVNQKQLDMSEVHRRMKKKKKSQDGGGEPLAQAILKKVG